MVTASPASGFEPLTSQLLSTRLLDAVTRWFGTPGVAAIPPASPDGDQTAGLAALLGGWEALTEAGPARVVLFPDCAPGDLDGFFRLRLLQVLERRPPPPALSVVVLSTGISGRPLAGGFAERFRAAWPFAGCVFLTEDDDHAALTAMVGLPVWPLDEFAPAPEVIAPGADANQKIAVQMQLPLGRCGNTTLFENQIESLVGAGFLVIRVFADGVWRRGATLRSRLDAMIRENSVNAGGHVDVIAVPDGPPPRLETKDADAVWRDRLAATADCRIADEAILRAVRQAECVIANHIQCVGSAIALAPQARMLLALHEDRAVTLHHWAMLAGKGEAAAMKSAAAAARVQAQILGVPDVCCFISDSEMARLAPDCRRAVAVLPRVYTPVTPPVTMTAPARFDLLLVGSEHGLNIVSIRWFLDRVWRPFLQARSISVAIVGRAGIHATQPAYASPLLHFLGYVEDLEAIRSWCRLTVVPDTGGAGISSKLFTTLAVGHPLACTRVALRGLDPAVAEMPPAHNSADSLAADILEMLEVPERLLERQQLVRRAGAALRRVADYAQLVMAVPRRITPGIRKRQAQWDRIVGETTGSDAAPYRFALNGSFPMSGTAWDKQVLPDGWHEPERWGRWTDGGDASIHIDLAEATTEPLTLELDITPSAVGANLRISIDGTPFPLIDPVPGPNAWDIPRELSAGKTSLVVGLHVGETVCPARLGNSPDDRILGIGVGAVRLLTYRPTLCKMNMPMSLRAGAMPSRVLLTGWHAPEEWGCWTSKPTASLRLSVAEPMQAAIRLELHLALPPERPELTLSVNGMMLPAVSPVEGVNTWDLPMKATNGKTELLVLLTVSETFCAVRAGVSADDRELGIGVSSIRLIPFVSTFYEPGIPMQLGADAVRDEVLVSGWHAPEPWGVWTSQKNAVVRLMLRQPLFGPFRLEMDLTGAPVTNALTVSVNGRDLPMTIPTAGTNRWSLPPAATDDQQTLLLGLAVSETFCPAEISDSSDRRTMGVGVRQLVLHREAAAVCPIGPVIRVSSDAGDRGMLLEGWHNPEPWGCWTAGPDASILLRFDRPLQGVFALAFELTPPLVDLSVGLAVNDTVLDTVLAVDGPNEWVLPEDCTNGQTELTVHLLVARPARPIDVTGSNDERLLGVGVRSLQIRREA